MQYNYFKAADELNMSQIYVAQVKVYSGYSDFLHAPFGFEGPSQALEPKMWYHIPTDGTLLFSICQAHDKTFTLKLLKNQTPIELVNVGLVGSDKYVQFSARSPSISCKYIVRQAGVLYIKRFQMVLHNDSDFKRTCAALCHLRLLVKGARPTIPLNPVPKYASQRPPNTVLEPLYSQQPQQYPDEIISLETNQTQFECPVNNERFSPNIDASVNQQFKQDDFKRPSTIINKDISSPLGGDASRVESEKIQNSLASARKLKEVQISVKPPGVGTEGANDESDFPNILGTVDGHSTVNDETQVKNKKATHEPSEDSLKSPGFQALRGGPPETDTTGKELNASELDGQKKDLKNTPTSEFKISKKIIKQRLKDRKFLSWVNKVEFVLSEMSKTKGQI